MSSINTVILTIIFCTITTVFAQESCVKQLQENQTLFNAGEFNSSYEKTVNLLDNDDCTFSRANKEKALVLVIRNLIELGRLDELDPWYIQIYQNNKYFDPSEDLLEEDFMLHLEDHGTRPIIDLSFGFGLRFAFVNRLRTYSVYDQLDYAGSVYSSAPKPSFALSAAYTPFNHHRFNFGVSLDQAEFTREFGGNHEDFHYKFGEDLKSFGWNFDYYYQFYLGKKYTLSPFIGYRGNYLYKMENGFEIQYPSGGDYYFINEEVVHTGSNIAAKSEIERPDARIDILNTLSAGVDFSYRIERFYLFLNVGYQMGLKNVVVPSERYSNHELVYQFYYVDEDFKLNFSNLLIGLRYNLKYKVK